MPLYTDTPLQLTRKQIGTKRLSLLHHIVVMNIPGKKYSDNVNDNEMFYMLVVLKVLSLEDLPEKILVVKTTFQTQFVPPIFL